MSKILKLLMLVFFLGIFTAGCTDILPNKVPLGSSLKDILNSKDDNYDFLNDEEFLEIVDKYANTIPDIDKDVQYAIGNLDSEDNIPELAVFMDKDPKDVNGKTELVIYKFNGDSYTILDRIHMNHDTSNHLIEIGKIAENQNGLLVSNNVGAHSTVTYGFILEDGKLKSILNDTKVSLMSLFPENEIMDIDGDGILEFSIYTVNPETGKNSSNDEDDMMTIWYKWNGFDGANYVNVDASNLTMTSFGTSNALEEYSGLRNREILPILDKDLEKNNKDETTDILKYYIQRLEEDYNRINQSPFLGRLFKDKEEHKLSINSLNNLNYISRDNVLDKDVRDFLVDKLKLGYKLVESEGQFYFIVDNQKFIDQYENNISRMFSSYLKIKAFNSNEPYLSDGALVIDRDALAQRIVAIENYRLRFPYSSFIAELNSIYNEYVRTFILGSINSPNYDLQTSVFSQESLAVFKDVLDNHADTHFSEVVEFVVKGLENNSYMLTLDLKEDIEEKI